ncbi:hypothetical protein C8A05DRAFT_37996 [Staphylotrichum tortipilum]|uniref:Uncharacterized protein n=1 Tax=Staphylotrichum tortipilum TaxID=2831512 RepID=A0AAN6MDE4_9PEZI|nr:hypothetical protein C8A05DRAFT_37996 [Staphylotrichum longicolle]
MPSSMTAPMKPNASVPVAMYGKDIDTVKAVCKKLMPEYEAVYTAHDLPSALATFPSLFVNTPHPNPPNLGLYQNKPTPETARAPQAILFGGKVSDPEYNAITDAVSAAAACAGCQVQFVTVGVRDVLAAGAIGPNADVIAKIFRKKMAAGVGKTAGKVAGKVGASGGDGEKMQ